MKLLRQFILATVCLLGMSATSLEALSTPNNVFCQDKMIQTTYGIMVISELPEADHITSFQENGNILWDVSFNKRIVSAQLRANGFLYVLSKDTYSGRSALSCIDAVTGIVHWEKP